MKKVMDGNAACSYISYNFIEAAGIYPITPSSPISENINALSVKENKLNFYDKNVKVYEMQSEAGAIGLCHGLLQNGVIASSFTSSQGLLLMIPTMYKIAGGLFPFVLNVAARSIATHSLSILGDHQDIYAVKDTGFAIFYSSSVQEVMDLTAIPYLASFKSHIPFINGFDGFRTSHELNSIDTLDTDKLKDLLNKEDIENFRKRSLSNNNVTRGTNLNDDLYFPLTELKNSLYDNLPDIVEEELVKLNKTFNKDYHVFNYYGNKNAKYVILSMGSVSETIKEVIDYFPEYGLLEVHLFKPFSTKYFLKFLPKTVERIAVLERISDYEDKYLYLNVLKTLEENSLNINVYSGRYGLSSRNTDIYDIYAVYKYLENPSFNYFTIGIKDDIKNRSLNPIYFDHDNKNKEILVYGIGGDGTVSSSKELINIIGSNTSLNVQGYFEYDSKKASGVTKSHLRIGKDKIKSTYYVKNPHIVGVSKINYFNDFDIVKNISKNGILIINTYYTDEELNNFLRVEDKEYLKNNNISIYKIDASSLSMKYDLKGRIGIVLEAAIFKALNEDSLIQEMENLVTKRFKDKGDKVINDNLNLIRNVSDKIKLVDINKLTLDKGGKALSNDLLSLVKSKRSYDLKLSDLIPFKDGTFPGGGNRHEKRDIADVLPSFNINNCINCTSCSFVCPHGVIRPFLLTEEEYKKAPFIPVVPKKIKGNNYYFTIGVSYKDCTGCMICVEACPGKNGEKALSLIEKSLIDEDYKKINDYLFENVSEKPDLMNKFTVFGSQLIEPAFKYSSACPGCGEIGYLKLLSELFKDTLVIANATGCSSVYGGEAPATPYDIPWANSLFEDAAEFGLGLKLADVIKKEKVKEIIKKLPSDDLLEEYLSDSNYENSLKLIERLDNYPELKEVKDDIKPKSIWIVGGDGWAYDIGFGGLDHVLASGEDVNILVLDTELYSNTGGQTSKASRLGSINKFSVEGKKTYKKDLASIAMTYNNVYVAQVSLGASYPATIKAFKEAEHHKGPSLILAYSPCTEHKALGLGTSFSLERQKLAAKSGYFTIFRYNPVDKKLTIDLEPDLNLYNEFLNSERRYNNLYNISEDANKILEENKKEAMRRYLKYKRIEGDNERENIL